MLTVWEAPLTRPTMDIDLLGRIENSIETITKSDKGNMPVRKWNPMVLISM